MCGSYAEDSHFGFSGFDKNGLMQWTVANLHIDSIAANRLHWLIQELMVHEQNLNLENQCTHGAWSELCGYERLRRN